MFIQQPFRVQAEPTTTQDQPALLDNAVRMYYTNKGIEYSTDVVRVLRIDVLNPVFVGEATQLDVVISFEADTLEFYNQFVQSFIQDETTETLHIRPVE